MSTHNNSAASDTASDNPDNSASHSEALAHQLVRHLGINAARKTCTENHWTGVLDMINLHHQGRSI